MRIFRSFNNSIRVNSSESVGDDLFDTYGKLTDVQSVTVVKFEVTNSRGSDGVGVSCFRVVLKDKTRRRYEVLVV